MDAAKTKPAESMSRNTPGFFFAMRVLTGIVGVAIPVLLARSMSIDDFAAYATIGATAALSAAVSSLGVDRASLRFLPAFAGKAGLPNLVRFLLALTLPRLLALSLVVIGVLWSGIWLPQDGKEPVDAASGAITLIVCLSLTNAFGQLTSGFIQGLLLHGAYAVISFGTVLVRILALLVFLRLDGTLRFDLVLWVFIATELAGSAVQLAVLLANGGRQAEQPGEFAMPSFREVVAASKANYVSYLVGIPWLPPSLILLVSHFSTREVTAAYAFFLTLAERARMFLPVQMLQGYVEPIWARLYSKDNRINRFREPATLLLQANHFILALGVCMLLAVGDQLLQTYTKAVYADHYFFLLLILVQVGISSLGGMLWIGMNATHQSERLASAYMPVSIGLALLLIPSVHLAGASGVIITSYLPTISLLLILRHIQNDHFAKLSFRLHKGVQLFLIALIAGLAGKYVSSGLSDTAMQGMLVGMAVSTIAFSVGCLATQRLNRAQGLLVKHFIRGAAR